VDTLASFDAVGHSDRPRVAFITQEFPPIAGGGAGEYAAALAEQLWLIGWPLTVFAPAGARARATGSDIVEVTERKGAVAFWSRLPFVFRAVVRKRGEFEIIHGNGVADAFLPSAVARGRRVVTVHHLATDAVPPGLGGQLSRIRNFRGETGIVPQLERIVTRRAARIIAVTFATRDALTSRLAIPADRITVVHQGTHPVPKVDPSSIASCRARLAPSGETVLLAVGRLEYRKGTDILLRALASIDQSRQPTRLVLAGGGQLAEYRALAEKLEIAERVTFAGWVDDGEKWLLYAACDAVVIASRLEGFGLVALEAMSVGKPLLCTMTGAAQDGLLDEPSAILVRPNDEPSLRLGLLRLLSDHDRMAMHASTVAERVGQFSWRATAAATADVYRLVAGTMPRDDAPRRLRCIG
jgi:glycosyltransferase involved in cell wall biosynthesis